MKRGARRDHTLGPRGGVIFSGSLGSRDWPLSALCSPMGNGAAKVLTDPIADAQACRWELVQMPLNRPWPGSICRSAQVNENRHSRFRPACDAHGLITDPHASVARIAAKRRVAIIAPAFPLAATRLPLGHYKSLWLFDCYTKSETDLK